MALVLHYGVGAAISLEEIAADATPAQLGLTGEEPLADVVAATRAALADPLDFPTLSRCTTPGDRVVLALDRYLPQADQLVAAVVQYLIGAGVDAEGLSVLSARPSGDDPRRLLPEELRSTVRLLVHDADDRRNLAYLAADRSGEPVLVHRALHEADLVIPIGCVARKGAGGYYGIHGMIYPTFSDARTQARFRAQAVRYSEGPSRERLDRAADEAAWLLGIQTVILAVPAGGDQLLHIVSGRAEAAAQRAEALYRRAWDRRIARPVDLVIAGIAGGPTQQTWENAARALQAAKRILSPKGTIVFCASLSEATGPAVRELAQSGARRTQPRWRTDPPIDIAAAQQLVHAVSGSKLYWLGPMPEPLPGKLDLVSIEPDDLPELIGQHTHWAVLHNASLADVSLDQGA